MTSYLLREVISWVGRGGDIFIDIRRPCTPGVLGDVVGLIRVHVVGY